MKNKFIYSSPKRQNFSYVINANIGTKPFPAVERSTRCSEERFVWCKNAGIDTVKSTVRNLQTFVDKSQVSLSTGPLRLYPSHITPLTFSNNCRREIIVSSRIKVAYLLFTFETRKTHRSKVICAYQISAIFRSTQITCHSSKYWELNVSVSDCD